MGTFPTYAATFEKCWQYIVFVSFLNWEIRIRNQTQKYKGGHRKNVSYYEIWLIYRGEFDWCGSQRKQCVLRRSSLWQRNRLKKHPSAYTYAHYGEDMGVFFIENISITWCTHWFARYSLCQIWADKILHLSRPIAMSFCDWFVMICRFTQHLLLLLREYIWLYFYHAMN